MGEESVSEWLPVLQLVGPSAAAVLSVLILVVPIVASLVWFLNRLLSNLEKAQANDLRVGRVIERLCTKIAAMPQLVALEVAQVLHKDRTDSLTAEMIYSYKAEACDAEIRAAMLLSDEEARESACAEIRRKYE